MAKKKKEEPIVDSETGSLKVKEKQTGVMKTQMKLEEIKTTGKSQILDQEAQIKERLMEKEFQYAMQLKQLEARTKTETQLLQENRKDDRTKMQATQQSAMIDQKENNKPSQNFESSNDTLGGFNLGL